MAASEAVAVHGLGAGVRCKCYKQTLERTLLSLSRTICMRGNPKKGAPPVKMGVKDGWEVVGGPAHVGPRAAGRARRQGEGGRLSDA